MTNEIANNQTQTNESAQSSQDAVNTNNDVSSNEMQGTVHVNENHYGKSADEISSEQPENQEEWFYDDGVKGTGPKPDFLYDKYGSVVEQAKAVKGLRQILGDSTGAPEEYEINLDENTAEQLGISKENEEFKAFEEFAKNNRLSQEGFDKLLEMHTKALTQNQMTEEDQEKFIQEEIKKFGGEEKFDHLLNWAENNFDENEFEVFQNMITTAEEAKIFDKIRNMNPNNVVPNDTPPSQSREEIQADLRKKLADPRAEYDFEFQKQIKKGYEQLANMK